MRLIDADLLMSDISWYDHHETVDISVSRVLRDIKNQPTVEAKPVVHGEWVHSFGDEWKCSECGDVICTEGSWDKPKAKFCEECGADMRGEKNG